MRKERGGGNSPLPRGFRMTLEGGRARLVDTSTGASGRGSVTPAGTLAGRASRPGSGPGAPFTCRGDVRGARAVGERANDRRAGAGRLRRKA